MSPADRLSPAASPADRAVGAPSVTPQDVQWHELRAANLRLEQLARLKDDVVATCAHDLRSPLNVVLGHAQLLAGGLCGELGPRQRASVETILQEGTRMLALVEEMVFAARTGTDTLEVDPKPMDVGALLRDCRTSLAVAAAEKEQTIDLVLRGELACVADPGKLREAVVNVIGNAIKFTPIGGSVTVGADGEREHVVLWVRDTGPGFTDEELILAFERFRRGRAGADQPGAGLGLAICREIVERHGGAIWAEHAPGGGAIVRMSLPRQGATGHEGAGASPAARLLVIDDDREHADLLRAVLTRKGYAVDCAPDGADGLRLAREICPALILLDVMMPSVDGFTVAERLRRDRRTQGIPVLFLSACVDAEAKVRGFGLGAADYLVKPFHVAELLVRVEHAIHTSPRGRGTSRRGEGREP